MMRRKRLRGICAALVLWWPVVSVQTARGGEIPFVSDDTMVAIVVHPAAMLTAPGMEAMPREVYSAAGMEALGIDPLDVEQCVIQFIYPDLYELRRMGLAPHMGFIVRLKKPFHLDSLPLHILKATELAQRQGRSYRRPIEWPKHSYSYFMPDDQTLLIATDEVLTKFLAEPSRQTPLREGLESAISDQHVVAALDVPMLRELYQEVLAESPPASSMWNQARQLADQVDLLTIRLKLGQQIKAEMFLKTSKQARREDAERTAKMVVGLGRQALLTQLLPKRPARNDPVKIAAYQYFERMLDSLLIQLKFQRQQSGVAVTFQGDAPLAAAGIVTALTMPTVQAFHERIRQTAPMDDLKLIGKAMHYSHDTFGKLPARASFDREGNPLLSWRVHLLPFLGHDALYNRFRLNEPWNSEHNKKLIPLMPKEYSSPYSAVERGKTTCLALVGQGTAFEGKQGKRFADFTDGTSNSVLLVDVDDALAVEWTKPEDYEVDRDNPTAGLRRLPDDFFPALFADGQRWQISLKRTAKEICGLFTIAGGEPVEPQPRPMR